MVSTDGIKKLRAKLADAQGVRESIVPAFREAMEEALDAILPELPKGRSGDLRKATGVHYPQDLSAEISTDDQLAPHAKYVYGGTRAHRVNAVRAKALQWFKGGAAHYARSVLIPAMRPNPYLDKAWRKHEPVFVAKVQDAITTELNNL